MHPKDADGMANTVDPDQTAPILFAQAYLSENLGSLRYSDTRKIVVIILKLEQCGSTVE